MLVPLGPVFSDRGPRRRRRRASASSSSRSASASPSASCCSRCSSATSPRRRSSPASVFGAGVVADHRRVHVGARARVAVRRRPGRVRRVGVRARLHAAARERRRRAAGPDLPRALHAGAVLRAASPSPSARSSSGLLDRLSEDLVGGEITVAGVDDRRARRAAHAVARRAHHHGRRRAGGRVAAGRPADDAPAPRAPSALRRAPAPGGRRARVRASPSPFTEVRRSHERPERRADRRRAGAPDPSADDDA